MSSPTRWLAAAAAAGALLGAGLTGCGQADSEPGPATAPADPAGPCSVVTGSSDDFPAADSGPRIIEAWVPPQADAATPLLVAVHPALSTGEQFAALSGFDTLAARDDVIVVYPSKAADPAVWDVSATGPDVAFVAELVDYMHAHGCGAPENTTVLGYSSGAMLTSRLACTRPQGFSSAIMVAGLLPPTWTCQVPADLAIFALHATADSVVRYDGEVLPFVEDITNQEGFTVTRAEMIREWSLAKGCPGPPGRLTEGRVSATRYECPPGAPTTLATYTGGGHDWRMSSNWDTSTFVWSQLAGL